MRRLRPVHQICDSALGVFVPTGVLVVVPRQSLSHLHHREHAAHLDRAELALPGHHRQRVVGQRHFHFPHVGHAAFAHHHVVRHQLGDLFRDAAMIDADHGRDVVAHGVHGVVRFVTVKCPVAGLTGVELDRPHLAHRDIGGHFGPSRSRRGPAAIGACDDEFMAVQVNRVIGHGEIADANADTIILAHDHVVDPREHAAVEREQVEIHHGAHLRGSAAGIDVVVAEQEHEVTIDPHEFRIFRMSDPEAHHPHRHLHHLVRVGVIHECARPLGGELVHIGLADGNLRLIEPAHAVHAVGQSLSVPVDGGVLRELVGDEKAHLVALDHLDGRPRALAVVAPKVGLHARREFAHHRLGDEMEFLDAVLHPPGQRPAVQRHHRVVRTAAGRSKRRLRGGLVHAGCLGHGALGRTANRRRAEHRRARLEKYASGGVRHWLSSGRHQ